MKRKIAVVTTSRADYGLLKPLIAVLRKSSARLSILASGTHLSESHGSTASEIRSDGFKIAHKIDLAIKGDTPKDLALVLARAVSGFAAVYRKDRPDLVVVLGDRYEVLGAAAAALPFCIPVAHIHGGEATEGLIDEQVRHAVTKLSHLHFPVTRFYRQRIIGLGEDPSRVFCFGAPGLDGIRRAQFLSKEALLDGLRIPPNADIGLIAYHPVTLDPKVSISECRAVLSAAGARREIFWIVSLPNADTNNLAVRKMLSGFASARPGRAAAYESLGRARFLSALKAARVLVGNSSSGIIEAPTFALPTVNVGRRQAGRLRAANVIDVPVARPAAVARALDKALSPRFKKSLRGSSNPYEGKNTCSRIADVLLRHPLGPALIEKRLHA